MRGFYFCKFVPMRIIFSFTAVFLFLIAFYYVIEFVSSYPITFLLLMAGVGIVGMVIRKFMR